MAAILEHSGSHTWMADKDIKIKLVPITCSRIEVNMMSQRAYSLYHIVQNVCIVLRGIYCKYKETEIVT